MVNETDLAVRAAVDGLGIAYTVEALAEPFLRSGQLVRVLEDWSPSFEGLFLYYPGHRQVPATLRALIDMIRTARGSAPPRKISRRTNYGDLLRPHHPNGNHVGRHPVARSDPGAEFLRHDVDRRLAHCELKVATLSMARRITLQITSRQFHLPHP
jgi:hypothetical protein